MTSFNPFTVNQNGTCRSKIALFIQAHNATYLEWKGPADHHLIWASLYTSVITLMPFYQLSPALHTWPYWVQTQTIHHRYEGLWRCEEHTLKHQVNTVIFITTDRAHKSSQRLYSSDWTVHTQKLDSYSRLINLYNRSTYSESQRCKTSDPQNLTHCEIFGPRKYPLWDHLCWNINFVGQIEKLILSSMEPFEKFILWDIFLINKYIPSGYQNISPRIHFSSE